MMSQYFCKLLAQLDMLVFALLVITSSPIVNCRYSTFYCDCECFDIMQVTYDFCTCISFTDSQGTSTVKNAIPLTFQMRAATATALGGAAARAKLLADQEDREIECLVATIIETQVRILLHWLCGLSSFFFLLLFRILTKIHFESMGLDFFPCSMNG